MPSLSCSSCKDKALHATLEVSDVFSKYAAKNHDPVDPYILAASDVFDGFADFFRQDFELPLLHSCMERLTARSLHLLLIHSIFFWL